MENEFVHLHLHSEYSLLDGCCRLTEIPKRAKELGQTAVALTDHGVMYGAVAFYDACKKEGIKPIIGCEVYVAKGSRFEKTGSGEAEPNHLVLLVKNETGYKNLIYMVSKAFTEGFYRKPRVDLSLLADHAEGLIASSACLAGYIPKQIMNGNTAEAEEYAKRLNAIFGQGNFYLELQNEGIDGQMMVNECIAGISERTGIPMIATNDVHYLRKEDADTQAVMMCIQTNSRLADGRPLGFETNEYYMKSGEEMARLFARYEDALANTARIAGMCCFDFVYGKTKLPRFDPPEGMNGGQYLKKLAYEGLERLEQAGEIVYTDKNKKEDYKYRIEYEHIVVCSMGYAGYYLIVADFVNYARDHGITTGPGRGSGAGSLLAYLIGITEVDPVKHQLLFESFLNKERISMPDFDIDFCYRRRDEVIAYVGEKYGSDHVAQIVTFGTMAAKAALRDVGRVMGMSFAEVDEVVAALPDIKGGATLDQALQSPSFRALYDSSVRHRDMIDTARKLEGMPRNASTHAAGVVITDLPVTDYVPLSVNGETAVTQFDMDTVARLGLLKFDFLALRYLTIIADTEREIRKTEPGFDIRKIPFDDADTYRLIASGKTDGLFQLESAGMQALLVQMAPCCLSDIMIAIALYRPGPMDAIPKFLENRKKQGKLSYSMDCLSEILDETCGCITYQEQVMQIFRQVAGYTYGKADVVRRAIAKKKPGVIESERESFLAGAVEKGYERKDADALYDEMVDFANYAFKKSHAAAYAYISYRTAYLKTHYAPMYYAALITSVFGNLPKMADYIGECAKMGIPTLPPDINESENGFSVSGGAIRFGLPAIKNVGEQFIERVMRERKKRRFSSFYDFLSRMNPADLNKRQIEALIKAGVFDSLGVYRSRLLAVAGELCDIFTAKNRSNVEGQMDMFGSEEPASFAYPDVPEFPKKTLLFLEKESTGMYLSGHILDSYSEHIAAFRAAELRDIAGAFGENPEHPGAFRDRQNVSVAGILTHISQKSTKNGDTMAFCVLEDRFGEIELIIFPDCFNACRGILKEEAAVCIYGSVSVKDGEPKIIVRSLQPLQENGVFVSPTGKPSEPADGIPEREAPEAASAAKGKMPQGEAPETPAPPQKPKRLYLRVPDRTGKSFTRTLAILEIFAGNVPVVFYDLSVGKYIKTDMAVGATPFVLSELSELLGKENVVFM